MPVIYNSKAIIPAPFVSISKEYIKSDNGDTIGSTYVITLSSKLVSYKGSPNSTKTFWTNTGYPADEVLADNKHFPSILRKIEGLRILFADEGKTLDIQPYDGSASITCNPRVRSLQFPQGQWVYLAEYTITLEADVIYVNGQAVNEDDGTDVVNYKVSRAQDSWNIEPANDNQLTYRLTRTVGATGKKFYNSSGSLVQAAYLNAKDYVTNRLTLGLNTARITDSVLNLSGTAQAFNYVRAENIDEKGGSYSVTETWLVYDPAGGAKAVEEFNIVARQSEEGRVNVTIDGTINGLFERNGSFTITTDKYTNALAKYNEVYPNFLTRAQNYSGTTLNSNPLTKQVTHNVTNGSINYSWSYDNRPSNSIAGAISEVISVTFGNPTDVFAKIPVLGRAAGPVLQSIGTVTERTKGLNIEAVMQAATPSYTPTAPDTDLIVLAFTPIATQVFLTKDDETWNPYTGRYTRTVGWTYQ